MTKGKLFIITGTSAVGKTSVAKKLLGKIRKLKRSLTYTTRPIRQGEKNHRDYNFISVTEFRKKIRKSDFLEWANNYGNLYGTNKKEISQWIKKGYSVLVVIDIKGALNIKKKWPQAVAVFILPESFQQLSKRFAKRADTTKQQIVKRLKIAKWELLQAPKCDYGVINKENQLLKTVQKVKKIIELNN